MSGTVQRAAEKALTKRYEALLRLSQTLISIRSSQELFNILAHELRAVMNFYVMGVGIYDEHAHEVRLTSYGEPGDPLQVPKLAPEETFSWWMYERKQAEDRLQLLLDVTSQLVSNLQLHDLLRAISASVRRVMHCDLVSVCFPDSDEHHSMRFKERQNE
jgi:hypothetical protein